MNLVPVLIDGLDVGQQTAPAAQRCPAPPRYPHTSLLGSFASKQSFDSGDKVYYSCAEDFTPSSGSRAVQCRDGLWSKLTLKCASKKLTPAGPEKNNNKMVKMFLIRTNP